MAYWTGPFLDFPSKKRLGVIRQGSLTVHRFVCYSPAGRYISRKTVPSVLSDGVSIRTDLGW